MDFKTIGFIGLGLIGGSIAKTIRRIHPDIRQIATSGHLDTVHNAYNEGIIENDHLLELSSFCACDIIFLCCPTKQNLFYLKELKPFLKKDCIVTDVGSVKGDIHKAVHLLDMDANFIGGHPMTGSEQMGYAHSNAYLLENAYYILTPTSSITQIQIQNFQSFISSLGAITLRLTDIQHDFATAAISHLPHIIASGLVNLVDSFHQDDLLKAIAAGGFRDITRIASSSPVMWQNICLSNKEQIVALIEQYQDILNHMKSMISENKEQEIFDFFSSAKDYRDSLHIQKSATFQPIYAFYCDLIDEAGGIATIATILASNNISIKNIGIIHNREFEHGVLRIELYNQNAFHCAIDLLKKYHYTIYEQ